MFGLFTPISYNTNLTPLFTAYYQSTFSGYAPYMPVFNSAFSMPYYGGTYMTYPYMNYQYNNYYPNIFGLNYASPYFGGGYYASPAVTATTPSSISAPSDKTASVTKSVSPPSKSTSSNATVQKKTATNPIKTTTAKTAVKETTKTASAVSLNQECIDVARKYLNCSEYDNSHLKFCNNPTCMIEDPLNQEWCTDFVTYVVKEAYRNKGELPPSGFGNHDVRTLKNWAINNGYFIRTSNKSQKGDYIAQNIKPGDIMIINENGASHTGFVTSIDKDSGVIHTIEGNRDDRVKSYAYSPNYPDISGFIKLTS